VTKKDLTHQDLSELLKVSETTIKSYRRKFADCIPVANHGKPIRFAPEAAQVCLRIRDMFSTGMSVPEVRARLAAEFAWIPPMDEPKAETPPSAVALPQDFTQAVSNLARGMVTLTQQQSALLKRLEDMEAALSGTEAPAAAAGTARDGNRSGLLSGAVAAAVLTEEIRSLQRMLAESLAPLAILQDLDDLPVLAGSLRQSLQNAQHLVAELHDPGVPAAAGQREEARSKVLQFPSAENAAVPGVFSKDGQAVQAPPRQLLTAPLVVRTEQGGYISAGWRPREHFSMNDFKALLAVAASGPDHFVLNWESSREGWWLALHQPGAENPRALRLLLVELTSKSGLVVAEVAKLMDTDRDPPPHPAELCAFIEDLAGM